MIFGKPELREHYQWSSFVNFFVKNIIHLNIASDEYLAWLALSCDIYNDVYLYCTYLTVIT